MIVMSYRQDEDKWIAERLYDLLRNKLRTARIRPGVEQLVEPGEDYLSAIPKKIAESDVLVVCVGPRWLGEWLNDPVDYDRIALEAALKADIRVIPVLIEGASMPTAAQLPEAFASFIRRMPFRVNMDTFAEDSTELARLLQGASVNTGTEEPFQKTNPRYTSGAAAGAGVFGNNNPTFTTSPNSPAFLNAIRYPFTSDERWFSKIVIGMLISLIPFFGALVLVGYGIRITQKIIQGEQGLPDWDDLGGDLARGFVVLLGSLLQAVVYVIPMVIIVGLSFSIGAETYIDKEMGRMSEPHPLGMLIGICAIVIFVYLISIVSATALANYARKGTFSAFTEFKMLFRTATSNYGRNLAFIGNMLMFYLLIGIVSMIGFYLLFIPGLFLSTAGQVGYYFLIAHWYSKVNETSEFEKPKNDFMVG